MAGLVIVGAGPGLGRSIAQRFAREEQPVALIARSRATVDAVARSIEPLSVETLALTGDSADEKSLRASLDLVVDRFGVPDVAVYNAAVMQADTPDALSVQGHLAAWAVNVVGALTMATHILPSMASRGTGSFIVTGGMPHPVAAYASLSLGKGGVRALTKMLSEYYGPAGVHVATVTVYGGIAPGTAFDPDDIAEHYWTLHLQPRTDWELEVHHTGGRPSRSRRPPRDERASG